MIFKVSLSRGNWRLVDDKLLLDILVIILFVWYCFFMIWKNLCFVLIFVIGVVLYFWLRMIILIIIGWLNIKKIINVDIYI